MRSGPGESGSHWRTIHGLAYHFMTTTYIILAVASYTLSAFCVWAERKSRAWYLDRRLLVASGYLFALANVATVMAFNS